MATVKSYTDIEQSKKLSEILPLESADMCWFEGEPFVEAVTRYEEERAESHRQAGMEMYPCWSLAALLDILPDRTCIYKKTYKDGVVKYKGVATGIKELILKDNPVDACVTMIEKLYEQKLLQL